MKRIRTKFTKGEKPKNILEMSKDISRGVAVVWDDKFCDAARYFASKGFIDRQIAKKFHIGLRTFHDWMYNRPKFREAIEEGRALVNQEVELAFFKMAVGFTHPDVYVTVYRGEPILVPIEKYIPPNPYAAYKWLLNRAKDRWNDTRKVDAVISASIERKVDLSDFSTAELITLEKLGLNNFASNDNASLN